MDLQTLCDNFCIAAQNYASLLGDGIDPNHSNLGLPNVLKFSDQDVKDADESISDELQLAQTKMIDAMKCCEEALKQVRLGTLSADGIPTDRQSPVPSLPLEVVQQIIAIGYGDEEIFKPKYEGDLVDLRDIEEERGAMGLVTHTSPGSDGGIFSLARLTVVANRPISRKTEMVKLDDAPRARYRIIFPDGSYDWQNMDTTIEFMEQRAGEVRTVQVYDRYELEACSSVLPFINSLEFLYGDSEREPDSAWLRKESETWQQNSIRSATIASPFLKALISSGILRNVTHLSVPFGIDLYTNLTWPTIDEILKLLPDFPRLVSLELKRKYEYDEQGDSSSPTEADRLEIRAFYKSRIRTCPLLPSLRMLKISSMGSLASKRVLYCLHQCDLREIALIHNGYGIREKKEFGNFCRKLSDKFPNIEKLTMTTLDVRGILLKSSDTDKCGSPWNFPNLHTLDIRDASWSSTIEEMIDISAVLYERSQAALIQAANNDNSIVPSPINRLYMDSFDLHYLGRRLNGKEKSNTLKKKILECQRLLTYLALCKIVPNLVWLSKEQRSGWDD